MIGSTLFVWSLAAALAIAAQWRQPALHRQALEVSWQQLRMIAVRVPLTLLAASYALALLPEQRLVALLGDRSGAAGILLASLLGAALPGGPMVTFPVVVALRQHGVGDAQTVSLLTAWSVLALHRVLAYELPLLGARFVLIRLGASLVLPVLAGFAAAALWAIGAP